MLTSVEEQSYPSPSPLEAHVVPLAEQARILELTHDTVIIRDLENVILYWNDGAEKLYGYTREEALGARCDALLQCILPDREIERALTETGRWSGEMSRTRRDGTRVTIASRWLQRRGDNGESLGVMETSVDLTEQQRSSAERERIERRYSAIFHAAGFATWESDWSHIRNFILDSIVRRDTDVRTWLLNHPEIIREAAGLAIIREVNPATLSLFEASSPADLVGTSIIGRYAIGGENGFAEILAGMIEGRDVVEAETQLTTLSGKRLDIVLRGTLVADGEPWSRVLVMAFDETERKEARAKLEQSAADLAHASRISILGQLTASIAHEVNQPLTAILTYGKSGRRWLSRDTPDLEEVDQCLDQIVSNASRAADVIARIRALARNTPTTVEAVDLPDLIEEALSLVRREAQAADVATAFMPSWSLPQVTGDRVQIQQVVVNLIMNAVQALHAVADRPREIDIRAEPEDETMVRISVIDTGPGFGESDPGKIFAPFFTTKGDGMGMGLAICRAIIEAQGGKITAENNAPYGAALSFTLPIWSA